MDRSNAAMIARVDTLSKMAESTRALYRTRLQTLDAHAFAIWDALMGDPADTWRRLTSASFVNADITAIGYMRTMMCVGYIDRLTRAHFEAQFDVWRLFINRQATVASRAHYTGLLTDESKHLPLDEVRRRVLSTSSALHLEKVIVAMYTFIPPCRLDYGSALIHTTDPNPTPTSGNHVIIAAPHPRVVLNEYKTARQYGQIVNPIPPNLLELIVASLRMCPRQYIFGKNATPAFASARISRATELVLGVRLSCNDLRRLYASSINAASLSNAEHADFARRMGHSAMTSFQKYRRVQPTGDGDRAN
jgi:hypothetical protein